MISLVLKHRFIIEPVLLSSTLKHFIGLEHTARLINLVKEYTPEDYGRAIESSPVNAAGRFAQVFSKKYFPIRQPPANYFEGQREQEFVANNLVKIFVAAIPLEWRGMRQLSYDSGNLGLTHQLAGVLCACPFAHTGGRIVIVERFKKNAGAALVKLLPAEGYPIGDMEYALNDDPAYSALLVKCRWLFALTGNVWLDHTGNPPAWSREWVDALARGWPLCVEAEKKMNDFDVWLRADFPGRSAEIIKYVNGRIKNRSRARVRVEVTAGGGHDNEE